MPSAGAATTELVTYLEMTARPVSPTPPVPAAKLALLHAEAPTVRFYRFLLETLDHPWDGRALAGSSDDDLAVLIGHEQVEIYVLYVAGVPAGFSELDRRAEPGIELARFGLTAEFRGRSFTNHFLRWTIDRAWTYEPGRLWVRVSSDEDPRLLALYQRNGFTVYRRAPAAGASDAGAPSKGP